MSRTKVYGAFKWGIRRVGRRVQSALGEARARVRQKRYEHTYGPSTPCPYRLIYVDPGVIDYLVVPRFDFLLSDHGTYILGGDWDLNTTSKGLMYANQYEDAFEQPTLVDIEKFGFYKAAMERFQKGVSWESTEFYRWCLERIEADKKRSPRFYTERDLRVRLELFDTLYETIRTEGYKTQRELQESARAPYHKAVWPPERHEVMISIGRNGDIFFDEGQHRFVIARLLGLSEIPVRVIVRHRDWQRKRAEIYAQGEAEMDSAFSDPDGASGHPDLADVMEPGTLKRGS